MPDLMRVAFATLAPFISGAERSLQITLRHLPAAGVAPLVIGPPGAAIVPWCERNGVPFLTSPLALRDKWHPLRWWRSVRRLRSLLREHRIDVVHSNQMWCYPAIGVAARDLGLPRVCHLRDEADPPTLQWYCASAPEAVMCISRHIALQAEAAWPVDMLATGQGNRPRIETRLNPVELPDFPDPADRVRPRTDARRRLGIPDGATAFGFIGQLREVKGLLELLDTLAVMPVRKSWHLLVAGRDPSVGAGYERRCRERAARPDLIGRVTFLGFLDDPAQFYQSIDCAVVPSLQEPLGRVPLEAAAFAKPSVAFAVGGLPDTIRDGETGWLVPAGDWAAFGGVLTRLLDQQDPAFGHAARVWVEGAGNPAAYAGHLAALYRSLLAPAENSGCPRDQEAPCVPC